MTVQTPAILKTQMPIGGAGQTSAADIHDLIDTFEDRSTQSIITTNANYTATAADNRRRIVFNSTSALTLTLPNSLPAGWECLVVQLNTGAVTIAAASGGALLSRGSHTKIAGRYGAAYVLVVSNAGTAAQILLTGDTST